LIGSDCPVCKLAGSYSEVMNVVVTYIEKYSEKDKNNILGGNAIKAYRLKL
jgi:L-fuconolactonase